MKIGYARDIEVEGFKTFNLQIKALEREGISRIYTYIDEPTPIPIPKRYQKDVCPRLVACLNSLKKGDELVIWNIDCISNDYLKTALGHLSEIGASLLVTNRPGIGSLILKEQRGKEENQPHRFSFITRWLKRLVSK